MAKAEIDGETFGRACDSAHRHTAWHRTEADEMKTGIGDCFQWNKVRNSSDSPSIITIATEIS